MTASLTSLQTLSKQVVDPLPTWLWEIYLPPIPGATDTSQLKYKAISTKIPETTVEEISWEGKGIKLNYASKRTFDGKWTCDFIESRDNSTRDLLLGYMESIRSWKQNTGMTSDQYKINLELVLLDQTNAAIRNIKLCGAWLSAPGAPTLDQGNNIQTYTTNWTYDWFEEFDPDSNQYIKLGSFPNL